MHMTKIPEPKTLTGNPALVHAGFDALLSNPLHLLQNWFKQAIKLNVSEPGGLVLSTVDSNGKPFSRVVLLKTIDDTGVIFASQSNSKKGIDISNNTSVAGTLWWRETMQQVNFMGSLLNADGTKNPDLYHGWFIGWIEKGDRRIIFSNHIEDDKKEEIGDLLHSVISLSVFSGFDY